MTAWVTIDSAPKDGRPIWVVDMAAVKPRAVLVAWVRQPFSSTYAWFEVGCRSQMPNPTHFTTIERPDIPT